MVLKKMPEDSIASIAGEITGVSKEQILQLIREVREGIEVDYIGLAELGKTK